ncbi:ASPG isoform 2 [Pan troglodytes]|uniref:ASPG isoform 2 n=2 Tax=Hominidae TaxID=9604 RepID=A0A2J8QLD3_PANTR|nr:ASPG isoform 2 [Pan troglodytes]
MARAVGPERRLLAVYTGGTIGMRSELGVLVPGTGLAAILRTLPMFHDEEHAQARGLSEDTLVLPPASRNQRILYTVLECQPLFDSSDMTIAEWVRVAQTIERHYEQYHGFVVIHGTDTMAFAASMLSFMLENLQKTVILTGAQVPIHALWSDGRENLLGALLMAGQYVIPELLTKDLRGEMTPPSVEERRPSLQGNTLGRGVSWLLSLSGSQEADALRNALVPSLACAAAHAGDLEALQALMELGSDLGLVDFNGQTPLHAAAWGGHTEAVTMLLQRGVDVNTRDTDGFSPLLLAVRGRHPGVIGLLREAGASLSTQELEEAGTELCRLAYRADLEGLQVWWQAGADLGQPGYDGHSALHVAEAAGNLAVVAFLQSLEGAVGAQAPCPEVLPGV